MTNLVQLRERFGDIWSDWKKKREAFGPGFYLYLGTRRGVRLYIENQFVNLVFGLEAFHRRKYPPSSVTYLDAKIERIVEQISLEKDKKWLAQVLERTKDQPPLGQRLYATLRDVPLGLDEARLKSFCEVCEQDCATISRISADSATTELRTMISSSISKARAKRLRPSIRPCCFTKSASTSRSSNHGYSTAWGSSRSNIIL